MRPRAAMALAAMVIATVGLTIAIPGRRGWFDIGVYHDAVTYWAGGHGGLYAFIRPGSPYGFTYPPFAAICMAPMALLGWHPTIVINLALTVAASIFLLHCWMQPLIRRNGWNPRYAYPIAACLFALLVPVRDTFSYGQINLILVALVYADLRLLARGRRVPVGIGVGLAAAIKLTPAIFIVYFLFTRRWRAAATSLATAALA
ncbi:MAG TPA: glycosyltransferase family 87 protein, partial [Micromonosporaceae bacterium]